LIARIAILIAAALACAAIVFIAHEPRPARDPAILNTLRRGVGSEAESLDPQAARSEAALGIARDLYEGLTSIGPAGRAELAAADRFSVSADGRLYAFHLRPRLRWSNGDAVVAGDFVFAWRRLVDPATAAPYAQMLSPVRNAAAIIAGTLPAEDLGVRAPDAATLEIELERPAPYFLSLLAHPGTFPLHRASLAAFGSRFARPGYLVSNGAYLLARWDFGSKILAVRNHFYWNDANTHVDRVEYHSIAQAAAELNAYRADQLDCTSTVSTPELPFIRSRLGGELHLSPQLAVYYYGLNLRLPPFADRQKLRLALSMVIDRERLVGAITGLGEQPAYGFVPPQTDGYSAQTPQFARWPMQARIARARDLLRESGLRAPGPIELRYNTGDVHSAIAVAVASMWKDALGLDTRLHGEEFKVLMQDIDRGDVAQVFRASWVADYNDANNFLQLLHTGFGINLPHYSNPRYDELLDSANAQTDPLMRQAGLQEAERLMLADQPLIPLYFYVNKHLVKPRVLGWRDNVMNIAYSKNLSLAVKAAE
jgi:oligopeptide transport system substrate-binding protein